MGLPDPLGMNELFMAMVKDFLKDKAIHATCEEPPEPGSEKEKIQRLYEKWYKECEDIMQPPPDGLLPWQVVSHRILLIDPDKQYKYHLPRVPQEVKNDLLEKISHYVKAKWWKEGTMMQAMPLLCVQKKNSKLHAIVNVHQCNDNTIKDITPLPDQDQIRMDVAQAKYRSKIDLSDAYKQIRIKMEDIHKTAFGMFFSMVMQQGDCNAPATFQRLMTTLFRNFIG